MKLLNRLRLLLSGDAKEGEGASWIDKPLAPGVTMRLYSDNSNWGLINGDEYETAELIFLKRFLKPGDFFMDIGAHEGLYSLLAAHRVGTAGRVIAFEPSRRAHRRLCANIQRNKLKNVLCVKAGMSDEARSLVIHQAQSPYQALNSFGRPFLGEPFEPETVACQTLDLFLTRAKLKKIPDFIKVDVEGWEARVFQGAINLLSRMDSPVIQVEFSDKPAVNAGSSCAAVYSFLRQIGFEWFSYDVEANQLIPENLKPEYLYTNLFAIRQPDQVRARLAG